MTGNPRTRSFAPRLVASAMPLGLGTSLVEGLASWVARSAWRHQVPPGDFVLNVVAPALGRPHVRGVGDVDWGRYFSGVLSKPRASLQGRDRFAATWVEGLESATGQSELRFLTLLTWRDTVPTRQLMSAFVRHCPQCLADWHERGRVIYEPLVWSVAAVTICEEHRVQLEERCPGCGARRRILTFWSMPGHCTGCGRWLGRKDAGVTPDPQELEYRQFVSSQVGELLARSPELEGHVDRDAPRRLVQHAMGQLAGGSPSGLARKLHMTNGTVWMWQAGRVQPSLEALLRICRLTGIGLAEALGGAPLDSGRIPADRPWLPPQTERHRHVDLAAVAAELQRVAASGEPESLDSLSYRLRVKESQLRRRYPALCDAITAAGRAARTSRSRDLAERRNRAIDQAVDRHARAGFPATRRMVEDEVGFKLWTGPGIDCWRAARARVGMPV